MTPRTLLLIALIAGAVLALIGAYWGITAAGNGDPVPGGSLVMTWVGLGVVFTASIARGAFKKPQK